MSKWNKVVREPSIQGIGFRCPECHTPIELVMDDGENDGYVVTEAGKGRGQVYPDYVCMHETIPGRGDYCHFSGPIWIVDY